MQQKKMYKKGGAADPYYEVALQLAAQRLV
jgi:hypothetical protein